MSLKNRMFPNTRVMRRSARKDIADGLMMAEQEERDGKVAELDREMAATKRWEAAVLAEHDSMCCCPCCF